MKKKAASGKGAKATKMRGLSVRPVRGGQVTGGAKAAAKKKWE
jgi:hypothetical protein